MSRVSGVKIESSIPVQSRVSVLDLAGMLEYWVEREGVEIRSMSQLVNWSVSALYELVQANGFVGKCTTVAEAHNYLINQGVYQKSLRNRGKRKISAAITFENLRAEGVRPENYVPQQYAVLHNGSSVKGYREGVFKLPDAKQSEVVKEFEGGVVTQSDIDIANKAWAKCERDKKMKKQLTDDIKRGKVDIYKPIMIDKNGNYTQAGEDKVVGQTEDKSSNKPLQSDQLTQPTLPPSQEVQTSQDKVQQTQDEQNSGDQPLDTINSGIVIGEKWSEEQAKAKMDEIKLRDREREEMEMREIRYMMEQSDGQPGE